MSSETTIIMEDVDIASFSYRNNEQNIIYYCQRSYLWVIDYSTGQNLMLCNKSSDLKNLSTSVNGNYMIAAEFKSFTDSYFYVFDVDNFKY